MSFLKKLFSSNYRRAVALEGAGAYRDAAEKYMLAGDRVGVCRMHRLAARSATDPYDRVDALRKALDFLPYEGEDEDEDEDRAMVEHALQNELADALVTLVEQEGVMDKRDRALLEEAVRLLEHLERFEDAGGALETLGYHARAAEAYKAAGDIGKMEEMFRRAELKTGDKSAFESAYDAYEFALMVGDHLGAMESLERCVELRPQDAGLSATLQKLQRSIPRAGRVTLRAASGAWTLVGGDIIDIGRDETNAVLLLDAGVSRAHVRLSASAGGVEVEDLGSTHGTFVGGARLKRRLSIDAAGDLRIGKTTTLTYHFDSRGDAPQRPGRLTVASGPLKGQAFTWANDVVTHGVPPDQPAWMPPGLALSFTLHHWHVVPERCEGTVEINGKAVTAPALLRLGDELVFDSITLRIE